MSGTNKTPDRFESSPVELSKAGFKALEDRDIDTAESLFRQILEYEPDNCYAFVGLAECERKKGNSASAAGWYEKCVQLEPKNEVSLRGLIMCYSDMHEDGKIAELWNEHFEILNTNDSICLKAADAFRKLHNIDMAAVLYRDLLERDPENRYALSGMGHLLYEEESFTESIKYWQRLLDVDPKSVIAHTCIGNNCRKLRNFENGLEYYRRAAEIEPGNFYALFGMADCSRGMRNFGDALYYWEMILENDPANRMILTRAGEACMRLNDKHKAREYFEKALNLGDDLYALVGMARLEKDGGNIEGARSYYVRVQKMPGAMKRFGTEIDAFFDRF